MKVFFLIISCLGMACCNNNKFPYDAEFSTLIAHSNSKIGGEISSIAVYETIKEPNNYLTAKDLADSKPIKEFYNNDEILKVLSVVRKSPEMMEVADPIGQFGKVYHFLFRSSNKTGYLKLYAVEGQGGRIGLTQTWDGSGAYYGNSDLLYFIERKE